MFYFFMTRRDTAMDKVDEKPACSAAQQQKISDKPKTVKQSGTKSVVSETTAMYASWLYTERMRGRGWSERVKECRIMKVVKTNWR